MFRRFRRRVARRRFLVTSLTLAALAGLLIGAGQVSAAHPFQRDRGDCLRALAGGARFSTTLDELVTDGTITNDQKDAIVDALDDQRGDRPGPCGGIGLIRNGAVSDAVTELLDLSRREIRRAWLDGASLTEIAADQGVDRATLVDTITTALDTRLDEAVAAGTITAEQQTEIMTNADPVIERAVDLHRGDLREQFGADDAESTPAATESTGLTATIA